MRGDWAVYNSTAESAGKRHDLHSAEARFLLRPLRVPSGADAQACLSGPCGMSLLCLELEQPMHCNVQPSAHIKALQVSISKVHLHVSQGLVDMQFPGSAAAS